jgi:Glycosyl hydrolase family 26
MDKPHISATIRRVVRGDTPGPIARLPRLAAGGLLSLVLVLASVGGFFWANSAQASAGASSVPLGDYAGWVNASGIATFGSETNTHPTLATDYLDRTDGWAAMDNGGGEGGWTGTGYRLVLGVPILPGVGTLAQGATGAYNQYFATLAQNLVAEGQGNAILRLGWEFNGDWYPWSVANNTDAANFAAFWIQIVNTMRAVPGAQFQFLWNPNLGGTTSWSLTAAYPGNAYVDYIGSDVYDEYWGTPQTPQNSWSNILTQSWGLNWLVSFAASEGKPIAIPEWSVCIRSDGHGLGDDPYFINQFANWVATNNVAFTNIFSFNDTAGGQDNDITDGNFPNALAAFKTDFGGGSGASITSPTTTAGPTTTTTRAAATTTTAAPTTTTTTRPLTTTTTTTTRPPATVTVTTGTPGAPTGVTASVSGSTVTISWTNTTSPTFGDDVFRDGQEIAWPGWPSPVVTSYVDTGVAAGTHTYDVAAYNSSGVGAASASVTVTVAPAVLGGSTTTTTTTTTTGSGRSHRR